MVSEDLFRTLLLYQYFLVCFSVMMLNETTALRRKRLAHTKKTFSKQTLEVPSKSTSQSARSGQNFISHTAKVSIVSIDWSVTMKPAFHIMYWQRENAAEDASSFF